MRHGLAALILLAAALPAQRGDRKGDPQTMLPDSVVVPPATPRSPAEELATFTVADGFRVELVASEPLVRDPVVAHFDAHGRLWVCEWRSYMKDVLATDESEPTGRVLVLHDRDGDGRMDDSTVFLDGQVLPRAVMPMRGGALVIEPPRLYWCPDADGDLKADGKEPILDGFQAGIDNPEHSGNGLLWGLDNRIRIAGDKRTVRWSGAGFASEPGAGGGQWGITHDDRGRYYFNYNSDWLRCDLVPGRYGAVSDVLGRLPGLNHQVVGNQSTWPVRITPGINRGYQKHMLRDYKLARTTGVCSPHVYRSFALPCRDDVFVCEPCGNLVRRFVVTNDDGRLAALNPYEAAQGEFLASTDERFRPVHLFGGQDGGLYVVDMYRGVIQHRNYVTSFLRDQVEKRGLEQPIGRGRIWRVVAAGSQREVRPPVGGLGDAALAATLATDCGVTRDLARRELVQRQAHGVAPELRRLLRSAPEPAVRIAALSTLDGLGAVAANDLRAALRDADAGIICLGLQLVLPHLDAGDGLLWVLCEHLAENGATNVSWHLALAMGDVLGRRTAARHHPRALAVMAALTARADPDLRRIVAMNCHGRQVDLLRTLDADPAALRELARVAIKTRDAAVQSELFAFAAGQSEIDDQRALLRGAVDALPKKGPSRQGWLTFPVTPPALLAIVRTNNGKTVPLANEILAAVGLEGTGGDATAGQQLTGADAGLVRAGERVYAAVCAACHQLDGNGMQGLAPPLRESEWVTGPPQQLIRIALHGVSGPIEAAGEAWDREMPGQGHLADRDLAAALSYLRRAFGHRGALIRRADVAAERKQNGKRTEPWTVAELLGEK